MTTPVPALRWHWSGFDDLGVHALYEVLALRCRVFVLEQGAYLDPDGLDLHSLHLLGRDDAGVLQAYLRVVDAGARHAEPSIGRVIVAPERRGSGLGHELLREGIAGCLRRWPGAAIRISAQAHLQRFYAAHGFELASQPYVEDDIPHVQMLRRPR